MKILYVEDNPDDIDLTRTELSISAPHIRMEAVHSQAEALARLTHYPNYDLVMIDMGLPDGDGRAILTQIRGRSLPMAVVFITGQGDEETAVAVLKAGADDYVRKKDNYRAHLPGILDKALEHFRSKRAFHSQPFRVLYAEDDPAEAQLTLLHLAKFAPHIQLDVVHSAEEVITRLPEPGRKHGWDLLLLDYFMPGMSGLDLLKRLRQERWIVSPVVIITGMGDEDVAVSSLKLGANDYVVKHTGYLDKLPWVLENAFQSAQLTQKNAALAESEARYRSLVEHLPAVVYRALPDEMSTLVYISPQVESMLGFRVDEWLNDPELWTRQLHSDDRERVMAEFHKAHEDGCPFVTEYRIYARNGRLVWVRDETTPVHDEAGKLLFLHGAAVDITERKQAEEALRLSEEKMRIANEAAPIGIRIEQAKKCVYVNPAFARMFGYESTEGIYERPLEMLFAPEVREQIRQRKEDRLAGRPAPTSYETRGVKKNGEVFDLAVYVTRIDYLGEPAILGFTVDLSTEKALRDQLFRVQKMEALGTLAGGIAHDFNNILGIIFGYTEMALYDLPKESPLRIQLEQIVKAGRRAKDLVKQILAFSRSGEQERQPLLMSLIVKEALKMLRSSLPTSIEIRQQIKASQGTTPGMVMADPTQIHQILMNLCTNASHAMREKGGVLEVSLVDVDLDEGAASLHPDLKAGPYVDLIVSDTGHGMDAATKDRIFEPYFTTKALDEGTGLGLAVVHGIVKAHEGAIKVESEPGKGTVFQLYLPRIQNVKRAKPEASEPPIRGTERILFVDDEENMVHMWAKLLEPHGYRVLPFTTSIAALKSFRAGPDQFDLVITDQTMPHMSGADLAREMLSIRPDIPIILCTGYSESIKAEQAKAIGIREYIMKPLELRPLTEAIRRAVGKN